MSDDKVLGAPEDVGDIDATEEPIYCEDVEMFDGAAQKAFLFKLRNGVPTRMAARLIGFTPRVVREYRKRDSLFDEECEEAIAEADEEVEFEARRAMKDYHEPWATKLLSEKLGWKRETQQSEGGASKMTQIDGNPMERIAKLQSLVEGRKPAARRLPSAPAPEPPKKPRVQRRKPTVVAPEPQVAQDIDVSLADE